MRVIETASTESILDDDGIITTRPLNVDEPRDAELVTEILDGLAELAGGERRPVLWIPGDVEMKPGGWQALINRVRGVAVAVGILVTDGDVQWMGAFPSVVDSLMLPLQIFDDEAEARSWLLQFADPP